MNQAVDCGTGSSIAPGTATDTHIDTIWVFNPHETIYI